MKKTISLFALKYGLIPFVYYLISIHLSLIRYTVVGEEAIVDHLNTGGKAVIALWHQRIFGGIHYARRFSAYEPSVMISQSRDGDLIAQVYSRVHFRPVRGSSSRGGRAALQALVKDLAGHPLAVHIVDGPRGPRGVVKGGLITLAQLSGAPIFPVALSFSRAWVLNSWDRFLIPKPFSTVLVRWGEPIFVPSALDDEHFESYRALAEERMRELQNGDDRAWGWEPFFS
jgi:lysophospholipid acyltransferase (LPLAT)-like uncharacterized protein